MNKVLFGDCSAPAPRRKIMHIQGLVMRRFYLSHPYQSRTIPDRGCPPNSDRSHGTDASEGAKHVVLSRNAVLRDPSTHRPWV
jgi:hypothetical protein